MTNDGHIRTAAEWRKSSYSNPNDDCVEVHPSRLSVRDSKNPDGTVLTVNVAALVTAIKAGTLTE